LSEDIILEVNWDICCHVCRSRLENILLDVENF
jgi:hypothetical protein